jgi:hypothetical protein
MLLTASESSVGLTHFKNQLSGFGRWLVFICNFVGRWTNNLGMRFSEHWQIMVDNVAIANVN